MTALPDHPVPRTTTELATARPPGPDGEDLLPTEPVALVDLLDRVLSRGVVVTGELALSIAGIDLVHVSLRALLSSARPDLFRERP